MPKLKILVPLDGSEKSMHSLNWLKKIFTREEVEVTLIYVTERIYTGEVVPLNIEYTANSGSQILDEAEKKLAGYKAVKSVEIVDALPKNASGKILKKELRKKWEIQEAGKK